MAQVAPNNAAVSSLLETAVSYDASMSIVSESERSMATYKRRTCICHMGDACQIMSTAYRTNKDPRGCFVLVPSYEVQLREAYCRHLLPNATSKQIDDIDDEFVVAVHHFHPTIIDRCFDTDPNNHQEDDILPMPARTVAGSKALEHLLSDKDKVMNHQTGAPTGEYWVVPSYPFDSAHGDLKHSMGQMEQLALERCIRRMKREARRQKWEAVVDKWEAVSKRSTRSISTRATEGLTVPSSPATTASRSSIQPPKVIVQVAKVPAPPVSVGVGLQRQLDELDASHDNKLRGQGIIKGEECEESERRGSMMTAQEVLQTELGDSDEESLMDDLHTVDEPPADMPIETKPVAVQPKAPESPTRKDDGSMSSLSNEESSRASSLAKPSSPLQPRVLAVNKPEIKAKPVEVKKSVPPAAVAPPAKPVDPRHAEMRKALDTLISAKEQQLAAAKTPEGVPMTITASAIPASRKPQVDPLLGTPPSEQTNVVAEKPPVAPSEPEAKTAAPAKTTPTITLPVSEEPQQVVKRNTKSKVASAPVDVFKATATKAFAQGRSFLKSQAGTAVAVGLYCVFAVQVVSTLSHCRGVLRSRGEAFEYY